MLNMLQNWQLSHMGAQVFMRFHLHERQHGLRRPGIQPHLVLVGDQVHLGPEDADPCEGMQVHTYTHIYKTIYIYMYIYL